MILLHSEKSSHRFTSIPVKTNLTEVQVARFAVNQYRFPGVEVKGYKRRYYPYGSALTHVIGYVSKINDKDVERLNNDGKLANYAATHDIGKLGIERYYEDVLHGQTGYEEVEVNNRGRVIRQLKEVPPQAGHDIYLTLDLKLQQYIETLLAGSRAAVVVTDPRTGGGLALGSTPSYDPNLFVDGISSKDYSALLNDPNTPLVNRATQGVYPPASTVKPYVAVSALSAGVITRNTTLFDHGWWLEKMGPRASECHKIAGRICGYLLLSGGLRYGDRSPLRMDGEIRLWSLHRYRPGGRTFR